MAQSPGGSFAEFRKGLLEDYNAYRKGVMERYDQFLDGVWSDFQQFKGEESSTVPKPDRVPRVGDFPESRSEPVLLPDPTPATSAAPVATVPQPEVTPQQPAPQPTSKPTRMPEGNFDFKFYDLPVTIPAIDINITDRLSSPRDNVYLKYELVSAYVDSRFPSVHSTSRMALKHYLLVGMGYDVRVGMSGNTAVLLIPFQQTVYARTYMKVNGNKYYIFTDKSVNPQSIINMRISTCELPQNANTGSAMDLKINGLNLPYKPHRYDLRFKDLTLSGEINANIFPILYRYPQMPTADFARSTVLADVREDIVKQFKAQLQDKDELEAVNSLLQFVQGAFEYATDEDLHGFEKPYFLEEILYYPKCDCEDRAIFYTYLLWNVLGVENQLINYPGHESASVKLSQPIKGDAYHHGGKTYYISDPTYIGSVTGMCMPSYVREKPGIDYTYGK